MVPSSSAHCADGQHDVGERGRLREEEVAHDEEVERAQALLRRGGRRGADTAGFEPNTSRDRMPPSGPSASSISKAETPGARDVLLAHAPHRGDVRAGGGVVDAAVAGKLVRLLAVLAPALAVALSGQAPVAAEGAARPAPARARC